jgi:hypothetical protein
MRFELVSPNRRGSAVETEDRIEGVSELVV